MSHKINSLGSSEGDLRLALARLLAKENRARNPIFAIEARYGFGERRADFVMLGGMFAGTGPTPGEVLTRPDGTRYKQYRGMASREAQDEFAVNSHLKAVKAMQENLFVDEIVSVTAQSKDGKTFRRRKKPRRDHKDTPNRSFRMLRSRRHALGDGQYLR